MGCGSSTAKGRDIDSSTKSKIPREAEGFFPPPEKLHQRQASPPKSAEQQQKQRQPNNNFRNPLVSSSVGSGSTSSPLSTKKKKEVYKPPPSPITCCNKEKVKATKTKSAYVPPAPITVTPPTTNNPPAPPPPNNTNNSNCPSSPSPRSNKKKVTAPTKSPPRSPIRNSNKAAVTTTTAITTNSPGKKQPQNLKGEGEEEEVSNNNNNNNNSNQRQQLEAVDAEGADNSEEEGSFSPFGVEEEEQEAEGSLDEEESLDALDQAPADGSEILGSVGDLLGDTDIQRIIAQQQQLAEAEKEIAAEIQQQQNTTMPPLPDNADTDAKYQNQNFVRDTPQPSSESGMRFDELYRLKGVLGTGAFSTVREGFHRNNNQFSYAVKCINRKKLSEEDEAALLDEVGILQEMKHVHIIRLYDFFTEPSTYYLVMERMRGGELFDRIVAKAYYNEKEARDTCRIVLEAVRYCHMNHIAHRDLKPENLLLLSDTDDSAVKIADFGFAKKVYEHNSLKTQCGTPGYVAPEILEGTPYDERADMWSVGVILYILLGGYPPFIESTQRDLFRKIRKGEYEFHEEYWGTVSMEAKDLISSLLTVDASDRLTAEEGLENPWIMGDDAKLASRDLGVNLQKFRQFNAKRKFRAAVSTIIAINKLNSLKEEFFTSLKDTSIQIVDKTTDEKEKEMLVASVHVHKEKTSSSSSKEKSSSKSKHKEKQKKEKKRSSSKEK